MSEDDKHGKYSISAVFLTVTMAFLGAYIALCLCEQLRQSIIEDKAIFGANITISHRKKHLVYLLMMSISIAGVSIWTMHFIGMNACHIYDHNGDRVRFKYNVALQIVCFFLCWLTTFAGVMVASYDPMFAKSKLDIVESFVARTKKMSFREIRKMTSQKMLRIIATRDLGRLAIAGTVMGAGIVLMHYLGMESVEFPGRILYDPGLVAASVVIAVVASTLSFWVFFRLLSIFPAQEWLRVLSALIMAGAVTGMHFCGMESATYRVTGVSERPLVTRAMQRYLMSSEAAYQGTLIAGNILLWLVTIFVLWNFRVLTMHQGKVIRQADSILEKLVLTAVVVAAVQQPTHSAVLSSTQHVAPPHTSGDGSGKSRHSLFPRSGSWSGHLSVGQLFRRAPKAAAAPSAGDDSAKERDGDGPSLRRRTAAAPRDDAASGSSTAPSSATGGSVHSAASSTSASSASSEAPCDAASRGSDAAAAAVPQGAVPVAVLRTLAEAYFAKRLKGHKRRLQLSAEGELHLQRQQQQQQMGFSEFCCHLLLLCVMGDWQGVAYACWWEWDSSARDSHSHSSDGSALNASSHHNGSAHGDAPAASLPIHRASSAAALSTAAESPSIAAPSIVPLQPLRLVSRLVGRRSQRDDGVDVDGDEKDADGDAALGALPPLVAELLPVLASGAVPLPAVLPALLPALATGDEELLVGRAAGLAGLYVAAVAPTAPLADPVALAPLLPALAKRRHEPLAAAAATTAAAAPSGGSSPTAALRGSSRPRAIYVVPEDAGEDNVSVASLPPSLPPHAVDLEAPPA